MAEKQRFEIRLVKDNEFDYSSYPTMYELFDNEEQRVLGRDGGEPEDQLLCRDWNWVAKEMNKLANDIEELRKKKS